MARGESKSYNSVVPLLKSEGPQEEGKGHINWLLPNCTVVEYIRSQFLFASDNQQRFSLVQECQN